jgi:hypothetical protein
LKRVSGEMTRQVTLTYIRLGFDDLFSHQIEGEAVKDHIKAVKELADAQRINKIQFTLLGFDTHM